MSNFGDRASVDAYFARMYNLEDGESSTEGYLQWKREQKEKERSARRKSRPSYQGSAHKGGEEGEEV
jgi:hypothetical protein